MALTPFELLILLLIFAFFTRTKPGIKQVAAVLWIIGSPCIALVTLFAIAMERNSGPYALGFVAYALTTIICIVWLIRWRIRQPRKTNSA